MNANKKNNMQGGWILCPSKTFPGKFYYFNVLNGETAWSLGDVEKKIIKKDGIIPKASASHQNPEPTSPPTNTPYQLPKFSHSHPTPVFGQSAFPQPLGKLEENIIWTPIHIQMPLVLAPERIQPTSQKLEAKTSPMWDFDSRLFHHTCEKPLSRHFENFERPVLSFDKDNKIANRSQIDKFYTSTPIKSSILKSTPFQTKPLNNTIFETKDSLSFSDLNTNTRQVADKSVPATDQIFQSRNNLIFSDIKPKSKQLVKESLFNIELPPTPEKDTYRLEEIVLNTEGNKDGIPVANGVSGEDLRMLLLAKKRKSLDFGVQDNSAEMECKKIKTKQESAPPKKRVTFNLDHEDIWRSDDEDDFQDFIEKNTTTMKYLRELATDAEPDRWCIIVDAVALLEEYRFLDKFVRIDPGCRLLVPSAVFSSVVAVARGEGRGRDLVDNARHLIRKLPCQHIIVQSEDVKGLSYNEAIIKSCVDMIYQKIHVVLITNDLELITTAKSYSIRCYHIQDIKNGLAPKAKFAGYKQNMKITIHNVPDFTDNGPAVRFEDTHEEYNEKEAEIIRNFKQLVANSNLKSIITNEKSNVSDDKLKVSNEISNSNKYLLVNECSKMTSIVTEPILNSNSNISNKNTVLSLDRVTNRNTTDENTLNLKNSNVSNLNKMPLDHAMFGNTTDKNKFNFKNSNVSISNETSFNTKAATEWRYAASDVTEITIDEGIKNLNIKEKTQRNTQTPDKQEKQNETVSFFFQKPSPKFDFQKFKKRTPNRKLFFDEHIEKSNTQPILKATEKEIKDSFEKNDKSTESFEGFKKPLGLTDTKIYTNVDLSKFNVKNKVMEDRLVERMEEFVCSFRQVMEETLSRVLESISSVPRLMAPPWSLYEALQSVKTAFKEQDIGSAVDRLCQCLYETDRRIDKMKINISPNEFMSALGYGVSLLKYLKNVPEPPIELSETEEYLLNMLKEIEDPVSDIQDLLVKTPAVANEDCLELRQNFVKSRTEVLNYLEKHYPKTYEGNKMKIIRTFGRNLNLLKFDKINDVNKVIDDKSVATEKNVVLITKNINVTAKNDDPMKDDNIVNIGIDSRLPTSAKNVSNIVINVANNSETEQTKMKLKQTKDDVKHSEKLENTHKLPKIDGVDSKNIKNPENTAPKPKTKSIFDFVRLKTNNVENREHKKQGTFKIDNKMLDVKITIPNKAPDLPKNGVKDDISKEKQIKPEAHKDLNRNENVSKNTEKGIKIVRNIHAIEEFEKRLKEKTEEEENSEISEDSKNLYDDETHYAVTNDGHSHKNDGYHRSGNSTNGYDTTSNNRSKVKEKTVIANEQIDNGKNTDMHNYSHTNDVDNDANDRNDKNNRKNYINNRKNDRITDKNNRKNEKDDNDSGFGNESPHTHIYSQIKIFSTELETSLGIIRTIIDGLQEYREVHGGKVKMSRLKAFEALFMTTKTIKIINKFAQKENMMHGDKIPSNNTVSVMKCLEQAEMLQNILNMILSVSNENESLADHNSSMSLNMS